MKARVNEPFFIPPGDGISYMLRVGAKIAIEFVTKVGFWRGRKRWEVVKDIF
jgi:hypothetical protein